jgi:hypothetical protein
MCLQNQFARFEKAFNVRRTLYVDFATNPRAPDSIVRREDFQGVDLLSSLLEHRPRYLVCLRTEAASIFSSTRLVSSTNSTALVKGEQMIMSGRSLVTKMRTGKNNIIVGKVHKELPVMRSGKRVFRCVSICCLLSAARFPFRLLLDKIRRDIKERELVGRSLILFVDEVFKPEVEQHQIMAPGVAFAPQASVR